MGSFRSASASSTPDSAAFLRPTSAQNVKVQFVWLEFRQNGHQHAKVQFDSPFRGHFGGFSPFHLHFCILKTV